MTMYADINFKTKKAFREAVEAGEEVGVFSAGIGSPPETGRVAVSGPHYPEPHRWYATVNVENGRVVKVR
jgi:hypothetical protein